VTSPFPPSGNEGYIRNRDVIVLLLLLILTFIFLNVIVFMYF